MNGLQVDFGNLGKEIRKAAEHLQGNIYRKAAWNSFLPGSSQDYEVLPVRTRVGLPSRLRASHDLVRGSHLPTSQPSKALFESFGRVSLRDPIFRVPLREEEVQPAFRVHAAGRRRLRVSSKPWQRMHSRAAGCACMRSSPIEFEHM